MTHAGGMRIGEAAARAGVSTRTLRYYQELGLLTPAATTAGGARRYSDADIARVQRILHLRDLVGLDLTQVGRVLAFEDRLAEIRREWFESQTPRRRSELLEEAAATNREIQEMVRSKMAAMQAFLGELEERAQSYAVKRAELEEQTLSRS